MVSQLIAPKSNLLDAGEESLTLPSIPENTNQEFQSPFDVFGDAQLPEFVNELSIEEVEYLDSWMRNQPEDIRYQHASKDLVLTTGRPDRPEIHYMGGIFETGNVLSDIALYFNQHPKLENPGRVLTLNSHKGENPNLVKTNIDETTEDILTYARSSLEKRGIPIGLVSFSYPTRAAIQAAVEDPESIAFIASISGALQLNETSDCIKTLAALHNARRYPGLCAAIERLADHEFCMETLQHKISYIVRSFTDFVEDPRSPKVGSYTLRPLLELYERQEEVKELLPKVTQPVFLGVGEVDSYVSAEKTAGLCELFGTNREFFRFRQYEGSEHNIMTGPKRNQLIGDLRDWLIEIQELTNFGE